jgi:hypothetical protein
VTIDQQQMLGLNDSFTDIAWAVSNITTWERHRIAVTEHLIGTGNARDPGSIEIGEWVRRSRLLLQAERIFEVLKLHEDEVRALDPALARVVNSPATTLA